MFKKNHISAVIRSIIILTLTGGWFSPQATQAVNASKSMISNSLSEDNTINIPSTVTNETAVLVKDINPGSASSGSFSYEFEHINGTLYLSASDAANGSELWKSDGTEGGTILVKDIRPGNSGSNPRYLENVNGILYFSASDENLGRELWKSDGTSAGTILVKDILPNTSGSNPNHLRSVNGVLYFTASDGVHGVELWKSDGTPEGTTLVLDINPGAEGANPENLTEMNGILYFTAEDGTHSNELWKSDGTAAGTVMVKDIFPGIAGSYPEHLTDVNGTLYFSAAGDLNGYDDDELWKSDGTADGTVLVRDIYPGVSPSYPNYLRNVNGILYFGANDGVHGVELWKSDGTTTGTIMVKDVWPGSQGGLQEFTNVGDIVYFGENDGANGWELWKSDGTSAGTVMIKDIVSGAGSSGPQEFLAVNDTVYFVASNDTSDFELWKTDGTSDGTILIKDINPNGPSYPDLLFEANGKLFFRANDGIHGTEPWMVTEQIPTIYYVNDDATGANDGTSWTDAYTNLQDAFSAASSGDEIWVAAGVYMPGTNQTDTFQLKSSVAVYGGFDGVDDAALTDRNLAANLTILSGDIDNNDDNNNADGNFINETHNDIVGSNSHHVVTGANDVTLDGFIVTAGYAFADASVKNGGGMYNNNTSPTIANVSFIGNMANFGGGIYSYQGDLIVINTTFIGNSANSGGGMYNMLSELSASNMTFNSNSAIYSGGGMYNHGNATVTNATFSNNEANNGGGMYNLYGTSNTIVTNVTFNSNLANNSGGGMYNQVSSGALITNVTFNNNSATNVGGGIYNYNSGIIFKNITLNSNSATNSGGGLYDQNSGSISSQPTLKNTIIANSVGGDCMLDSSSILNTASSNNLIEDASNACGLINGVDGNIVGVDSNLGSLVDNGGFTEAIELLLGSPAIDAGDDANCPATDQRGVARPQGLHCDIGAYEFNSLAPLAPSGTYTNWDHSFQWIGLPDATWYLLEVQTSGGTQVFRKWYTSAQAGCSGSTNCSVPTTNISPLPNGDYKWRIMDYGDYGYGTYTPFLNFTLNTACSILTMNVNPPGSGTINAPAQTCEGSYTTGSTIQLTAVPNSGYIFTGWSGDANGASNPISVTMDGHKSVTANFTAAFSPISPSGTLNTWDNTFTWTGLSDATWYLIEVQTSGGTQVFRKWYTSAQSGCSGSTNCYVAVTELSLANGDYKWRVMDYGAYGYGANTAFLNFTLNLTCYTLTTSANPAGSGIFNVPAQNCAGGYTPGSLVQLTVVPNTGYTFTDWSGDANGTTNPLSVTMDGDKNIIANMRGNTPISPSGTVTSWNNTFTWTGLSDASWYLLEVQTSGGTQVFRKWYTSDQTGCTSGTACSITPSGLDLENGDYKWRVMDYGAYGYGLNSAFKPFTLNLACYALTINIQPAGTGTVDASVPNCAGGYKSGSWVELTATPGTDYLFSRWSGDANSTSNPVSVTMNGDKTIAAEFIVIPTSSDNLFMPYVNYPITQPQAVGVGDFNNDSLPDVAVTNSAGELKIFYQNLSRTLGDETTYATGTRPEALAVGDLNHDGRDDIAVTNVINNTLSIFIQQTDGTLADRATYTTGTSPDAIAVGDINNDGMDDVVVSNWNSPYISVFIQNINGTLNAQVQYSSPQAGYDDIAIGDVNNDGLNDVVKMNGQLYANPDLSVYLQTQSQTLSSAISYSLPGNILGHGIGIGDVTGDGRSDVVMSYGGNRPNSNIAVFPQGTNGSLQDAVSYGAYDTPEPIEVADVNNDGKLDVITAHGGWNAMSVYTQQRNGTLGSYTTYPLRDFSASHYKPQALVIEDINQDGMPDTIIANLNYGLDIFYHVPPDGITPLNPSGTLTSWDNAFRWIGLPNATWYLIEIQISAGTQVFRKWYTSDQAGCTGSTNCSIEVTELSLANGDYKWRVMDYGAYGYGINSAFKPFTLDLTAACYTLTIDLNPAAGGAVNTTTQNCAGGYTTGTVVQLTAVPNTGYLFDNWSGDVISSTNPISVTMNGDKTVTASFKAITVLTSPSGTLNTWVNTFTWSGIPTATWYLLEVYTSDDTLVFRKWYTSAQTGCSGGTTCSNAPPETAALANGDYQWKILDYGAYGYGIWTPFLNFSLDQ